MPEKTAPSFDPSIYKDAPMATAVFDRELRYLFASDRWYQDYGLTGQDIIGKSHYEIFPEIPEDWRALHRRTLAGETLSAEADPFPRDDGSLDWVRWKNAPWRDENGEIGGMIMFTEVITDQVLMRRAFEHATDGVARINARGKYDFADEGFAGLVDRDREALKGMRWSEAFETGEEFDLSALLKRSGESRIVRTLRTRAPNGGQRALRLTIVGDLTREGDYGGYSVFAEDATEEQAQKESELRQAEWLKLTETIAEIGHWYVDLEAGTVFWSDQVYRIHGLAPGEYTPVLDKAIEFYHPDDRADVTRFIEAAIEQGTDFEFERRILTAAGNLRWVTSKGECRLDERGKTIALFGVFQDITERRRNEAEIRETKTRYETAMSGAQIGFWEIDLEGDGYYWTPLMRQLLGWPKSQPLNSAALEKLVHPEDRDTAVFLLSPGAAEAGKYSATIRLKREDGEYSHIAFRGRAEAEESGKVVKLSGSFVDETQEHKGRLLRELIWKTLTDQAMGLNDKIQNILIEASRYFELEFGIVAHIENGDYLVENVVAPAGELSVGDQFEVENTYCIHVLNADGVRAFHHVANSEIRSHPCYKMFGLEAYIGAPLFVDGVRYGTVNFSSPTPRARDFTAQDIVLVELIANWLGYEISRRRTLEELAESEERFALAAEGTGVGIWDWQDVTTDEEIWSDQFYRLLDYAPGEIEASVESFQKLLHPDDHTRAFQRLEQHFAGEGDFQVEYRLNTKKRGFRWFLGTGQAVWDKTGAPRRMIGSILDIDDRKRAESLKSEFVSTVSHELRTPMTSIMGAIGLVRSGKFGALNERAEQLLGIAEKNGQRLVRLINDLLDIEKIEAGKLEFAKRRISVSEQVHEAVEQNQTYAAEQRCEVSLTDNTKGVTVCADPDRLQQVLVNLLANAAKFTGEDGRVEMRIESDDDKVSISVTDNGPGIPEDKLDAIFNRFVQADSGDTRTKEGTGLGLSISKAIAEAHDGTISVSSPPGEGATFTLTLPLWKDNPQAAPREGSSGAVKMDSSRPLIIHIEDDQDTNSLLRHLVDDFADVEVAPTLRDAERRLERQDYDLVVLDLQLPDGSGEEIIESFERNRRRTPFIVYSVFDYTRENPPGFIQSRLVKSRVENEQLRNSIIHALDLPAGANKENDSEKGHSV